MKIFILELYIVIFR